MDSMAAPALKLRSCSVNTVHRSVPGAKSLSSGSSKARMGPTRVNSIPLSELRPRSAATTSSFSVTRRFTRAVKPITSDAPHAALAGEREPQACGNAPRPLSSIPTNTSHRGDGFATPSSAASASRASARCVKPSNSSTVAVPHVGLNNHSASRVDSTCSSLRGSSDKGSADRQQRPPVVPHVGQLTCNAPATWSAAIETLPMRRTATAATITSAASALGSQLSRHTASVHEMAVPMPPKLASPSVRPYASAPASRVSSVNSRLAEATARSGRQLTQRSRTSSVRPFVTKRSGSSANTAAPTKAASLTAAPPDAAAATSDCAVTTPFATSRAPPRLTGTRPLLETNRVSPPISKSVHDVFRVRALHPNSAPVLRADRGARSARGGASNGGNSSASRCTSARGASSQARLKQKKHSQSLAEQCATEDAPSRKLAQRLGSGSAAVGTASAPPAPFQKTHTRCPPPLSFADSGGASAPAIPKGPISPIKRTSTACPSAAQRYPNATADKPVHLYEGLALPITDATFAGLWIKPGMLSTPTNRAGDRDASEAPTIPYEGSRSRRGSTSLSPRTDVDALSVSGRLSYGV
ncbi:hypothetical protein LSCM1_01177 [Leishmania martiniquensis]|uniref:Uncharacterized protein n=1 Tax=Leishmania martiniquensis TaxID=1580590 RepID=A0A836K8C2_9TRYP|nr:hypothetical protein LSCM1_01177 [Leishmania martiniquensis]